MASCVDKNYPHYNALSTKQFKTLFPMCHPILFMCDGIVYCISRLNVFLLNERDLKILFVVYVL